MRSGAYKQKQRRKMSKVCRGRGDVGVTGEDLQRGVPVTVPLTGTGKSCMNTGPDAYGLWSSVWDASRRAEN